MGTAQLRPGGKDSFLGPPEAETLLAQDSLLSFPQPPSPRFSCWVFEGPTSFKRVMLEGHRHDPGHTGALGWPPHASPQQVSPERPVEPQDWSRLGRGLTAFVWLPHMPPFPSLLTSRRL